MEPSLPDALERQHTLTTAVARFNDLRTRDAMAATAVEMDLDNSPGLPPLSRGEVLEMLALSEVIARKATYGRQTDIRTARRAGASWSLIGTALGTSKQSAWEAHSRWIDVQAERYRISALEGLDETDVRDARSLAGDPDDDASPNQPS